MAAVTVRVPASSANLGPGFDAFACALGVHTEVEVVESGRFAVETDLAIARDRRNLVVRGFERLRGSEGCTFRIRSEIPLAGGLGTSAAAYVAGLLAADRLGGLQTPPSELVALAAGLEGHPDNAAAAVLGGFVICAPDASGAPRVARFAPAPGLDAVLVVPHEPVRTSEARAVLPAAVPLADASFNVGHGAQLTLGLLQGDWDLVGAALRDRLHQPYRAPLFPRSAELVAAAEELGALGATISGAGPTVLVWARTEDALGVTERVGDAVAVWADVLRVSFEARGAVAELR